MAYIYKRTKTKHRDFVTRTKCFYYNPEAAKKKRAVRLAPTPEGKKKRNERQKYLNNKYLLFNNFDIGDMWVTLTYRADTVPESEEAAHKLLMKTLSSLQKKLKRQGVLFRYFVKTEAGDNCRPHHHLIIKNNFNVVSMLYEYWKGFGKIRDFSEIYSLSDGKLIKYFLDGGEHKNIDFEKYSHSRNLIKPETETRIYPAQSFREVPKAPKCDEDDMEYKVCNLKNFFPDADGYIYQEYELVKVKKRE